MEVHHRPQLDAAEMVVQAMADPLPIPVYQENDTTPEELRLKYRFLDLRREKLHQNIMKRGAIIDSIRRRWEAAEARLSHVISIERCGWSSPSGRCGTRSFSLPCSGRTP